jgi:two-component system NtrC family response regulator
VRGAFTGAAKDRPGRFQIANNGTLLLDEVGELPPSLQAKLLRVLQEGTFEPVGSDRTVKVDVRILAATHVDLRAAVASGRFREDLYYRLAEIVVSIPPLRERPGDSALLAHAFVQRFAAEQHRGSMVLRADAIAAIESQPWSGNVRELENCMRRAVIMSETNQIAANDLALTGYTANDPSALNLRRVRDDAEKRAVITALGRSNENVVKAAEMLGVSRPTLYDLMRRFGLK